MVANGMGPAVAATPPSDATASDESQYATHAVLMQQQQHIHSLEVQLASSQAEIARLRRIARGGPAVAAVTSYGALSSTGSLGGPSASYGFPGGVSPLPASPPEPVPPPVAGIGAPAGATRAHLAGAPLIVVSAAPSTGSHSTAGTPLPDPMPGMVAPRGVAASCPTMRVSPPLSLPTAGGLPPPTASPPPPPPSSTGAARNGSAAGPAVVAGTPSAAVPAAVGASTPTTASPAAASTAAGAKKAGTSRYWTAEEHARFLDGLSRFGAKDIKGIARHVGSRSATQVRTHQQKYNLRLQREKEKANSAGVAAAGAGAAPGSGAPSPSSASPAGALGAGSHGVPTSSPPVGAGVMRSASGASAAVAAAAAAATAAAAAAAAAGKDVKPVVGAAAAGHGAMPAVGAPGGSRFVSATLPAAGPRTAGAPGLAVAAVAGAAPSDKRLSAAAQRKGQSPKRNRPGKRARSNSAPVIATPAEAPGARGAGASSPSLVPRAAVATVGGGATTPSGDAAVPVVAGVAAAPAAVAVPGMGGVDGATKVRGEAAVVPMEETATDALLGGRPPLRRSGSSSVLLSELPFLQRPLMSAEGFALGRDGTGAISSVAGGVASGSANGVAVGGATAASATVPGAPPHWQPAAAGAAEQLGALPTVGHADAARVARVALHGPAARARPRRTQRRGRDGYVPHRWAATVNGRRWRQCGGASVLVLEAAGRGTNPRLWSLAWASAAAALTISRGCRRWRTWRSPRRWRCNCRTPSGLDRTETGAVGVVVAGGSVALRRRLEMSEGVVVMFYGLLVEIFLVGSSGGRPAPLPFLVLGLVLLLARFTRAGLHVFIFCVAWPWSAAYRPPPAWERARSFCAASFDCACVGDGLCAYRFVAP
eukprot:TRINITY_DN1162_c0_g1_i1.p1 TRINITY_DN1162_c0_g1~~TRINITY_DN1162_c0_g1_i1.p1  ORF type:complete len:879 (-),score=144.99 TRINITY_DN1162_c0_g1_i1:83-2719(-)